MIVYKIKRTVFLKMMKLTFSVILASILFSIEVSCQEKKHEALETLIDKRIFDNVGLLTAGQKKDLYRVIQSLEKEIGSQIAIIIVDTLKGKNINTVSIELANKLNLGRDKFNDGILILTAYKDRKVRIEVGYGLEKIIRDEVANRILREKTIPRFKIQEYYQGLLDTVIEISQLIKHNRHLIGKE